MGARTQVLLRLNGVTERCESDAKHPGAPKSAEVPATAGIRTCSEVMDQTIDVHLSASDVMRIVNPRIRGVACVLFLVASLATGFSKYSLSSQQPCLSVENGTAQYQEETKSDEHDAYTFFISIDQILSYLVVFFAAYTWPGVAHLSSDPSTHMYWIMARAGVIFSLIGWMALVAPCCVLFLQFATSIRQVLIVRKAAERWGETLYEGNMSI